MAYFSEKGDSPKAWEEAPAQAYDEDAYEEEFLDEYDEDDYDYDDYLTEEEYQDARRFRFRMAAGLLDFLLVVVGMVVILLLAALLVNMITWLQGDIDQMFTLLQRNL